MNARNPDGAGWTAMVLLAVGAYLGAMGAGCTVRALEDPPAGGRPPPRIEPHMVDELDEWHDEEILRARGWRAP